MNALGVSLTVFSQLSQNPFDKNEFLQKVELQKYAYFMNEFGVPCGDYSFFWNERGPYSQELQNEIYSYDGAAMEPLELTPNAKSAIEKISIMKSSKKNDGVEGSSWLELLASVHFLKEYVYSCFGRDYIFSEIVRLKPQFNDRELFDQAYGALEAVKL